MTKKRLILGVDFDGTIVTEAFPEIGKIKPKTVELMKRAYENGHLVIIWTARTGQYEQHAINFLNENDIPYHYVNENPEDEYAINGGQGRKIFCDYYIDDRAVHVDDIGKLFAEVAVPAPKKATGRAILKQDFSIVQWHGEDYGIDEYQDDADESKFKKGEIVEVLKHVGNEGMGELYVIFSPYINESTVVYEGLLEFI